MDLGLRRRPRALQPGTAGSAETLPEYFGSNLLAMLFEQYQEGQRLRVLDVGPCSAQTVAFFSRYRSRLHCADLYDEPELLSACEPEQEAERIEALRDVLGVCDGVQFDICLFWDLFRCIDGAALKTLGLALAPAIGPRTLAHGFLCHGRGQTGQQSLSARSFGIVNASRVSQRAFKGGQLPASNVPQRQVLEQLGSFAVDKSRLLQGGLLEVVLQSESS